LDEAKNVWIEEVRGVEGNFLGLIDENDNTIQFYFESGIPNGIEDARHLRIVLLDFPVPDEQGSYCSTIRIDEVDGLIERACRVGAHHRHYDVEFRSWQTDNEDG
jgi:hypothetical protein